MFQALGQIAGWPYMAGVALRNALYRRGLLSSETLNRPVISVGNLTFGGTGKTPMIVWLAKEIAAKKRKPGILSRGYKASDSGQNDEARMIADSLPQVPHIQNPDRVQGGKELISRHAIEAVLLDDGFQHLRLRRDLDILLVDATDPFGGESCPPFGRLRESLSGLRRADAIVMTRCDLVSDEERNEIWLEIERYCPQIERIETGFKISGVLETETKKLFNSSVLRGRNATLVCAIGNPKAFRKQVEHAGIGVYKMFSFRDHHHYKSKEIEKVFKYNPQGIVLTTQKDWVKIRELSSSFYPWVLEIEPKLLRGDGFLDRKLDEVLRKKP